MEFKDIVDYISLLSGIMTILGIGGLLSWSIVERKSNILANKIYIIFSYSLKTAAALFISIPFIEAWKAVYTFLFRYFASGAIPLVWDSTHPVATIASYSGSLMLIVPIYLTITACLYFWSLSPLLRVWGAIRR